MRPLSGVACTMKTPSARIITREVREKLGKLRDAVSLRSNVMWYVLSAADGTPQAFSAIGFALDCDYRYKSLNRGAEHVYWYRLGARLGDDIGAYNLGQCYEVGRGVKRDMRLAVFWWKKAAALGYPLAFTCLAAAYYNGTGVRRDRKASLRFYKKAAAKGDKVAQKMLVRLDWSASARAKPIRNKRGNRTDD